MGLDKVSRDLLVKLFFKTTKIVLLLFASFDLLKNTERSFFLTGVEEDDLEVQINWRFGNCFLERLTANCARNCWRSYCSMGENAGCNVRSSTISGAIGRRPLQEQFPNRQLIWTSESYSSTPVRKENLSVFFNTSILAKSSCTIVVASKKKNSFTSKALVTLSRPMLIVCNCNAHWCLCFNPTSP